MSEEESRLVCVCVLCAACVPWEGGREVRESGAQLRLRSAELCAGEPNMIVCASRRVGVDKVTAAECEGFTVGPFDRSHGTRPTGHQVAAAP